MSPVIGFSDYGHLGTHSAQAARLKGFVVSEKIEECDIVFISPDRPGEVSPEDAVKRMVKRMNYNSIMVVLCQVPLGFTRKIKLPDVRLYYQVETLKVNDEAMERALYPERIIIGRATPITDIDIRLYQFFCAFECPIIPMSYESAELAKMAINLYLVVQLETTNMLSSVSEKIGADWEDITLALKTDRRIGQYAYLKPGKGIGPHLQRDVDAIKALL